MLKNRMIYMCIVVFEIIIFAMWNSSFAVQVIVFTLLLPILSYALLVLFSLRISVDAMCARKTKRGSSVEAKICVRSKIPLASPNACVYMTCTEPGRGSEEIKYMLAGGRSDSIELSAEHCGRAECAVSKVRIYDNLGLFSMKKRVEAHCSVVVFPIMGEPREDVHVIEFTKGQSSSEVYELRDYRPGDMLRTVHWKLSQKTDRLLIKEPQEAQEHKVVLAVDILPPSDEYDDILDELISTSAWMVRQGIVHSIAWCTQNGTVCEKVSNMKELYSAMELLLSASGEQCISSANMRFSVPVYHFGENEGDES